jgi:undecaprenyl-diphosphatase
MDYLKVADISDLGDLIIGALISAVSAYMCIHYFLILLERIGLTPFVVYRLVLGIVLLLLYA